ncbi:AAA domain-containing protein [Natranaerovirga pectinivora]|uniref:AAA domain-containing protein n=1 Tax=Natranaerovirga pectinivora TaxID=682400 RepID=A0A4R3MM57_9FIRM|nr:AAA family ATPase [Natranaerovirga pectinivora]TCT16005.1 AAA domain-containing protein [Natranaerovirga pectinivora]
MYILLEGMPGTGKTTIAKRLAQLTGSHYIKSVISESDFGNEIKKVRSQKLEKELELFFMSDLFLAELMVNKLLEKGSIIRDKSFNASLGHLHTHGFVNKDQNVINVLKSGYEQLKSYAVIPDLAVHLRYNEKKIRQNLDGKKDLSEIDQELINNFALYAKQDEEILKSLYSVYRREKVLVIECFSGSVEEMCQKILTEYKKRLDV